ncbi:RNA polymerase sigma factor [Actomonas aquatica]|uniref:Sigma-70 family RNA polymerase sigma factor n=1 Tax=Actomonas aquatica TaxID=2866162 RepID=A0ABZ1CAW6_9BACT|nr:sigma-70 family RNA polymerase sigma factor [Opitutus sp. WL0086]WRQ87450.1 sigma-70 family RNA polymerase sigma factor [Opitutus sp. WL0086]
MPPPLRHTAPVAEDTAQPGALVEHFFREESGRLHGALLRRFGVHHLTLVEDAVQEAMLRALRHWSMGGVPPNPSAWISRVAINHVLDALRRDHTSAAKQDALTFTETERAADLAAPDPDNVIADDTLRLLFTCCHPTLPLDAQAALALKTLCGFNLTEIARAFLASEAAIEKQLTRTKQRLRDSQAEFALPAERELDARLDGVLATLYLLFNEGYKASLGDELLREDLCAEAIRLTRMLLAHPIGDRPAAHALLALMLLHSARFPARLGADGTLLRLGDQDRSTWDQAAIDAGLQHLARAAAGNQLTEYHLHAGIAASHCIATDSAGTDWARILAHYDALLELKPSPVVALNRAVAVANCHGPQAGLDAIDAIPDVDRLATQHLLHAVRGELHARLGQHAAATTSFRRALALARVAPEQLHLSREIERLEACSD